MGDRANVGFKMENGDILYLYQHWGGHGQARRLAEALDFARNRVELNDYGYARRIVISQMIGDDWNSETGHGIYINELADNQYPVPIVDFMNKVIAYHEAGDNKGVTDEPFHTFTIDEFIKAGLCEEFGDR
jgi:hypothetical protein